MKNKSIINKFKKLNKEGKYFGAIHILGEKDRRLQKLNNMWDKRGYEPSETWDLASTLSNIILQRLKLYKKKTIAFPGDLTEEAWDAMLDKMILSFELVITRHDWDELTSKGVSEKYKIIEEGLKIFGERFLDLWW